MKRFVSRAGEKLDHALTRFQLEVREETCADLGCNAGGFTDCLLQRGAARVFAIDTGYGQLDYRLRKDARVIVLERTNAIHAVLGTQVAIAVIDVAWTRQRFILPAARRILDDQGRVVSLIKPHYEADKRDLREGILPLELMDAVLNVVDVDVQAAGFTIYDRTVSPIQGAGGNSEWLYLLRKSV